MASPSDRACSRCGQPLGRGRRELCRACAKAGPLPLSVLPAPAELPSLDAAPQIDTHAYAPSSTPTQKRSADFAMLNRPEPRARFEVLRAAAAPPRPFQVLRAPAMPRPAAQVVARSGDGARATPAAATSLAAPPAVLPPPQAPAPPEGAPSGAALAAPAAVPVVEELTSIDPSALAVLEPPGTAPRPVLEVEVQEPEVATPPPMPTVMPVEVDCVASVDHGASPEPGIVVRPYHWQDVLDGDAPPKAKDGEGAYAVYHAIEVDEDIRIAYQTVLEVRNVRKAREDEPARHRVRVDARVSVQKRALLEVMDAARARADQIARRKREKLARKLARRRSKLLRYPRPLARAGLGLVRAQARMGYGLINFNRRLRRGLVEIPDGIISPAVRVQYHLSTRHGRQGLLEGLKNPSAMNNEQRSAMLFLTVLAVGVVVLLLNSFFALAAPEHANIYRNILKDAATQFVGLFGLPIPIELPIIIATLAYGPYLAFTGFFIGKMLGAWVLYLLGDSLREHLHKKRKAKGKEEPRWMTWLSANANKYGFLVLLLDNALPLAPDQVMLVLAITGIRFRTWMLGIGIGTAIKYAVVIYGALTIGHDVELLFTRPWEFF